MYNILTMLYLKTIHGYNYIILGITNFQNAYKYCNIVRIYVLIGYTTFPLQTYLFVCNRFHNWSKYQKDSYIFRYMFFLQHIYYTQLLFYFKTCFFKTVWGLW